MKRLFSFFICLAWLCIGYSQSDLAIKLMDQLKTDSTNWYEDLIIEKAFPNSNSETILVLPEFTDTNEISFSLNTWTVVADNSTGEIKSKTFQHMESDAIVLTEFSIDSVIYQIAKDKQAFGVRTKYRGSSHANPYDYESLSLFVIDDSKITIVLEDFDMEEFFGEWDTNCAGEFTIQSKTLSLSKKSTQGYFTILVKNEIQKEKNFLNKAGECGNKSKQSTKNTKLIYQDGKYK